MFKNIAKEFQADKTCPVTTGIFLRIVSKASYEEYDVGIDFIIERKTQENLVV